jgi:hypothetical protein
MWGDIIGRRKGGLCLRWTVKQIRKILHFTGKKIFYGRLIELSWRSTSGSALDTGAMGLQRRTMVLKCEWREHGGLCDEGYRAFRVLVGDRKGAEWPSDSKDMFSEGMVERQGMSDEDPYG